MTLLKGFRGGSVVKNLPVNSGDAENVCLILGSGRSPGVGNGTPLQYSCLENPMDRGACLSMGSQTVGHDRACMHPHSLYTQDTGLGSTLSILKPMPYALTTLRPHPRDPNYPSPPCLSSAYKKEQECLHCGGVPSLVSRLL